ncbi:hypothetical protein Cgig2_005798 [Carnegiea gigantea]|uniref:Uncharacterized protein n=1 Tax=Carnegiea gigantea TaxID=171969 RepID=A0A9Q1QJ35_9CARY|nr:hypothetical protein Cgig2_005798 [Carnegiea gigantea]
MYVSLVDLLPFPFLLQSNNEPSVMCSIPLSLPLFLARKAFMLGLDLSSISRQRGIVEKLGDGRNSKLKVIGKKEVESSFYSQLVRGLEKSAGLDEELANEANKAAAAEKKRIAEEVASMLKLRVNINTGIAESVRDLVAALRAGAEIADVPICNCVLVAGSQHAVIAAEIIGMPCIFVRSRCDILSWSCIDDRFMDQRSMLIMYGIEMELCVLKLISTLFVIIRSVLDHVHVAAAAARLTSRAEFPSAVSVVDGFGNVGLTVSKLRSKLSTSSGA